MATSADESTPAARASALSPPRPASPEPASPTNDDDADRPRRRPLRTAVQLIVLVGILGGGLWAGWSYSQRQFYVGATETGQLAVFRGVPGQIAGLDLSSVHATSRAELNDLTNAAQEQVKQGIQAKDEPDAARLLSRVDRRRPGQPEPQADLRAEPHPVGRTRRGTDHAAGRAALRYADGRPVRFAERVAARRHGESGRTRGHQRGPDRTRQP